MAATGGVNSAEASVCFSCHETGVELDADPFEAQMVTFGATMDGGATHAGLLGKISACTGCRTPSRQQQSPSVTCAALRGRFS